MPDEPKRTISPERQYLYYGGMVCTGIGLLLFLSVFVTHVANFGNFDDFEGQARSFGFRAVGGMFLMMIGGGMMQVGRAGLAGSGVTLDPEKARKDLEPWNRAAGGMAQDAIGEIEIVQKLGKKLDEPSAPAAPPGPVVKVRCRACSALNDEHAKFCNQCGAAL